jgi:hypothetical protein
MILLVTKCILIFQFHPYFRACVVFCIMLQNTSLISSDDRNVKIILVTSYNLWLDLVLLRIHPCSKCNCKPLLLLCQYQLQVVNYISRKNVKFLTDILKSRSYIHIFHCININIFINWKHCIHLLNKIYIYTME